MRINVFYILSLSIILFSCLEEIDETSSTFEKVYGGVGNSQGEKIIPLSNGNLLLLGKTGVPEFNLPSEINEVIISGISATEVDPNGNVVRERIIPIPDLETGPLVDYQDLRNREIIQNAVETVDGGILFSGEYRFARLAINVPGILDTTINNNSLPFYGKLDKDLNLVFIDGLNKQTDPSQPLLSFPVLKRLENGRIYLLLGFRFYAQNSFPTGYTLFELDEQGKIIDTFIDERDGFKGAKDFHLDGQGDIVLIGQRFFSIALYKLSADGFSAETNFTIIDEELGERGVNRNPMYVRTDQNDDYVVIYSNSFENETRFKRITNDFGSTDSFIDVTGSSLREFPREFIRTKNGDFLLLSIIVDQNEVPSSILYRLNSQGEVLSRNSYRGDPGDILEADDGSIYLLNNPIYNDQLSKMTLRKLKDNGIF